MKSEQLLKYLNQSIDVLLKQGQFDGGQKFRLTQKQALQAYRRYLDNEKLTTEQKLKGFFAIPTGVGKTAIFVGIVAKMHDMAAREGRELKTAIVVPTILLLKQTKDSFEGSEATEEKEEVIGFAPQFKGRIGSYGNGEKDLSHPITVMTYDAWVELSAGKRPKIGSHNIDF